MDAQRLQQEHHLPCSHQAVARVLKHYGLTRKRRKKQQRKKSIAHIKRHWKLFGQLSVDTKDFHQRITSFQAAYNLVRPNRNKQNLTPWQIVQNEWPTMTIELAKLPPLMLDWIGPDYITKEEYALRGDDVPCYPSS